MKADEGKKYTINWEEHLDTHITPALIAQAAYHFNACEEGIKAAKQCRTIRELPARFQIWATRMQEYAVNLQKGVRT